jgi:hypothetical protein
MLATRLAILTTFCFANAAVGQPSFGSLIGSVEGDPMHYECTSVDASGKIRCDFVQVLLSNNEGPEELESALATIPEIIADADGSLLAMCKDYLVDMKEAVEKFERGETLDDGTSPPKDPEDLDGLRSMLAVLDATCTDRTSETIEALLRFLHEREAITCRPTINKFNQTFVEISEGLWVVESSPTGACGIIQTSRFKLPEGAPASLWEYTSQKVITNKAGVIAGGLHCSMLDETPILYTWKSGSQRINCMYID